MAPLDRPVAGAGMSSTRVGQDGTDCGPYHPGIRVRVHVPNDPHTGEIGTVQKVYEDRGAVIHIVRFENGSTYELDRSEITKKLGGNRNGTESPGPTRL